MTPPTRDDGRQKYEDLYSGQRRKRTREQVVRHFGSAPFFVVHDTDVGGTEVIRNENQHRGRGGYQPLRETARFGGGLCIEVFMSS
jgi:hypothetical protein